MIDELIERSELLLQYRHMEYSVTSSVVVWSTVAAHREAKEALEHESCREKGTMSQRLAVSQYFDQVYLGIGANYCSR